MNSALVLQDVNIIGTDHDGLDTMDVAIRNGNIAQIGRNLPTNGARTCRFPSSYVAPGFVDAHVHVFDGISAIGVPADIACYHRGVVAAADAGSAGAATFDAFQRVARSAEMHISAFLNVSSIGILHKSIPELGSEQLIDLPETIRLAAEHPSIIKGVKMRLAEEVVRGPAAPVLAKVAERTSDSGLPLMVHIGDVTEPLSELVQFLKAGDIVTHCYTPKRNGLFDDRGKIPTQILEARERGVLFDCAHGSANFSFDIAKRALDLGFPPDFITSDNSRRNWDGPVFDLATTASKLYGLGMPLPDVIHRITRAPAKMLKIDELGYGKLEVGAPARLTIFTLHEDSDLVDGVGGALRTSRIEPLGVVVRDEFIPCRPWGLPDAFSESTDAGEH